MTEGLSRGELDVAGGRWRMLAHVADALKMERYGRHVGDVYGLRRRVDGTDFTLHFYPFKDATPERQYQVVADISKPAGNGGWENVSEFVVDVTDPEKAAQEIMSHYPK